MREIRRRDPMVMELPTKNGRQWRLRHVVSGVRLEFRDPGEHDWSNAGNWPTIAAAIEESKKG